ncbi:MAG: NAD-dependent malic enzyme, partial [Sporomusa sp.]
MDIREEALKAHKEHQGKLQVGSKMPLKNMHDLSIAYTPGVAEPCKEINLNKELSFEYTCRGNMIAVISD